MNDGYKINEVKRKKGKKEKNYGQMDDILFSYVLVWYLNGWSNT